MNKSKKEAGIDYSFLIKDKPPFDFENADEEAIRKYVEDNFPESFPADKREELIKTLLEQKGKGF